MAKLKKLRRVTGTIQLRHLDNKFQELMEGNSMGEIEIVMQLKLQELKKICPDKYRAGALSLEVGEKTGRPHLQCYVERHHPAGFATYAREFGVMPTCFDVVRNPKGAYEYCSQSGQYENKKGVIEVFTFGQPVLYGGTAQQADLKWAVEMITNGNHPSVIFKENPYCYTVHRSRIWALFYDWVDFEANGRIRGPTRD